MQVNPESRALDGITTFLMFVALNLLYLATCLPVITIGVATSALYEVTLRYSEEESGNLLRDYFTALRRNFLPATAVYLTFGVPVALLGFGAAFWAAYDSPVSWAAAVVAGLAAAYLALSLIWGLALVARYTNAFSQTLRNALLLPGAELLRSLGIAVIPVTMVGLTAVIPGFVWIMLTIGFSVGAYLMAFLFRDAFRRHTPVS